MKYLIIGRQGCGLPQIINELEKLSVNIGHIFRNQKDLKKNTYTLSQKVYKNDDIEKMEISNSYIFLLECMQNERFIEGLSFWDYDSNDVIYMGIEHLVKIPEVRWEEMDVTIIWLDNNNDFRMNMLDEATHNIKMQEDNESQNIPGFIERIYEKPHIYFFNEMPERVATIVWSLVKHPDLAQTFIKNFN